MQCSLSGAAVQELWSVATVGLVESYLICGSPHKTVDNPYDLVVAKQPVTPEAQFHFCVCCFFFA